MTTRLEQQIAFLNEADKLKSVTRGTLLCDASRAENSAEHSWHLTLYALVLADQAGPDVDITRVIKMLILHDLVEIDAGDNPIFGSYDTADMEAQEQLAADRIFGILPNDLRDDLRATWEEFEANETPTARFAKSLDRFQPPMQNLAAGGGSWVEYNVTEAQFVEKVGRKIQTGAPGLWEFARARVSAWFAARG
ncbi:MULTISPECIES: HD domain-containing protein [Sulfitobacter]|jgi:putative hydrolase of HD superfamily|uniref:Putative hydrolases of HD superfamily n=3 Tax=Sulfitobacter TaxID=60136 RepID=A0A1H2U3B8_9RHOB|nr:MULTISPECIES: HD domain-containing protein [Sulfitobacter]MAX76269.1 HD domain-containing protein [Roseobacter sp.]HBU55716.1 HD domain-containing protein [Sulfitobacter sp.]QPO07564.1 HD domain-containing protein [Sulfitobacter sp. B30-2]SDW50428.1 putative hydrolases of HD superfamily [Sulfitobacter pontiacus]HJO51713.1 HD domain-containing protein [Sulfitobacter pontiacus]|tara:strand:- start:60 stop:641 length:582 start_codon:yes stop_codon:yes gene_type:complete